MLHQWGESDSLYLDNLAGIFQSGEDGFGGGRGATDATTCPWKTRRTDNTGSSVFLRDDLSFTRGEELTGPVTRLRRLFRRWNPDQRGNTMHWTQHISLSADAKSEQRCHARNPKHPGLSAFIAVPMPGGREQDREDRPNCRRKRSIQRWDYI